ncbi:hypothetical protein F5Y13DRAFT_55833 [Hypoxylon sp. FL1857]|nr:hypothetical protein F5Y13DRAFT_55833 [Hypoxylon sp. FL1857]
MLSKPNATTTAFGATGSSTYYPTATSAYRTQSGTIRECGNYYLVITGDDCWTIDHRFNLSFSQLYEWNTYLTDDRFNLYQSRIGTDCNSSYLAFTVVWYVYYLIQLTNNLR